MRYTLLGPTGLRVSELCLGTMTFGEAWGWGAARDDARAVFDAFAEAGGTFIDTANLYTNGQSETLVGEFLGAERDHFVLATKYTLAMQLPHERGGAPGDLNAAGNGRKNLLRSVEESLKRLRTDYLDLLWVHAWDGVTPVEEILRGLDDLVRQGKVHHVGVSDAPAWAVAEANAIARERHLTPFCALQVEYSLAERTPERELVPMARHFGMAVTPWSPLAAGVLTGKYLNEDSDEPKRVKEGSGRLSARNRAIAQVVVDVAGEVGASPAQVALAWLRAQGPDVILILGARNADQLRDNMGCLDVQLSDAHRARLDEVSRVELGFPHDFLKQRFVQDRIFDGMRDRLDA